MYNRAARGLVLTYGIILVLHYLVCFILLCIIYYKLLKYIRRIRREFGQFSSGYVVLWFARDCCMLHVPVIIIAVTRINVHGSRELGGLGGGRWGVL